MDLEKLEKLGGMEKKKNIPLDNNQKNCLLLAGKQKILFLLGFQMWRQMYLYHILILIGHLSLFLKEYLYQKFGLKAFLDPTVWHSGNELVKYLEVSDPYAHVLYDVIYSIISNDR